MVRHPASGLVTALEPVMRACSGVWVAHGSGSADRASSDRHGRVTISSAESSYLLRRVWLTEEEEQGYYYGFSNEALWPLCHLAHAHPVFRRGDWLQYQKINQRFADAVLAEVDCDDPIVLVQDYHFALVPKMLRRRLPRATILTFWHIPWPNAERFSICPYQSALLDGLLGSSMVAFQTPQHCHNFLDCVDRNIEAVVERAGTGGRAPGTAHARARLPDLHRVAEPVGCGRAGLPRCAGARSASGSRCRRRRGSWCRSIVSITRRGSTSGC